MSRSERHKKAGVMGWPVAHSLSPHIHRTWLADYGIDGEYLLIPVPPAAFHDKVRNLCREGFCGANVTVPHKEAALAAVDRVCPLAERIGAVNTLYFEGDKLVGTNSDAAGFYQNLLAGAPGWQAAAGPAAVLGAGGAARAVIVALLDAGAPEVRLVNRTRARAEALRQDFGASLTVEDWARRDRCLEGVNLLVNTTTLGMAGQPALEIRLDALPAGALVNDIVYKPLETGLLAAARARGNPVVDGLGMLLHQARLGFRLWFSREPEVTPALRVAVLKAMT
jgi:shikimate dehydrogenase